MKHLLRTTPILLALTLAAGCAHGRAGKGSPAEQQAARLEAGQEALRKGEPEKAIERFEKALAVDDASALAHRKRVEAYIRLGRTAEIVAIYRARAAREGDAYGRYALALALYASATTHADEALALLEAAGALKPQEAEFPYRRGVILLDRETYPAAIEAFEQAVALDPVRTAYRVPLALALHHAGRQAEGMKVLSDLLTLHPTAEEVEKARKVAEDLSGRFTGVPEAARQRMDLAIGWLEQADVPQNAIDLLRDVLQEFPDLAMAHALLGLAYQRIDSAGEALVHFRRAIEIDPEAALPHLYLGNFYLGKDRHAEAVEEYETALVHNPLLLAPHQMLAEMAVQRGDQERAERHLRAWSLLAPGTTRPMLALARIFTRAGRVAEAEAELQRVLELEPSNIEAHLGMAAVSVHRFSNAKTKGERKQWKETAETHLDAVSDVQPENAAVKTLRKRLGS
ncbi:MAG: tetratricopeptide repeat protein [Deltaproteobacteria bacterium]|nr:tetratricopeptide repeat protein [Deltaproteobacteria bacterium]